MRAELLPNFKQTWPEVWLRLSRHASAPDDLFVVLVGWLATEPVAPIPPETPSPEAFDIDGVLVDAEAIAARSTYDAATSIYIQARDSYESALSSNDLARAYFKRMLKRLNSETDAVRFLEDAYAALEDLGNASISDRYRTLVISFLDRYNLRYEVRGGFSLHATVPGLFVKMLSEVKRVANNDPHLSELITDFEEAFSDLKSHRTQARMKTCLQKQFNLLEGLGSRCPGITQATLGGMCDQVDWPHATIKDVGKKLYGFGSNYPGVRHAGNPQSALRNLDMRDFVSLSLMLASFTPYLTHGLDAEHCYTA